MSTIETIMVDEKQVNKYQELYKSNFASLEDMKKYFIKKFGFKQQTTTNWIVHIQTKDDIHFWLDARRDFEELNISCRLFNLAGCNWVSHEYVEKNHVYTLQPCYMNCKKAFASWVIFRDFGTLNYSSLEGAINFWRLVRLMADEKAIAAIETQIKEKWTLSECASLLYGNKKPDVVEYSDQISLLELSRGVDMTKL